MFVQELFLMKVRLVVHNDADVVVNKINEFRWLSPVAGQRRETETIFSNHPSHSPYELKLYFADVKMEASTYLIPVKYIYLR